MMDQVNRCKNIGSNNLMGSIKVIQIIGNSSLLLLLEDEDSLDIDKFLSCDGPDELPKWLLFSSFMEIDGEI